ncbi:MAG: hypothetical protein JNL38_03705 [Myxococcales bacterium]|jgi:hypothetical protein|nr:hypothetical protein [Myxococcales bacterium]
MLRRVVCVLAATLLAAPVLASCTSTIGIRDVYMSLDQSGARQRTSFFTDTQSIVCIIEYSAGREGATIEALIRQNTRYDFTNNSAPNADRVTGSLDVAAAKGANQVLALALTKKDPVTGEDKDDLPFPVGKYTCEVRVDGKLEDQAVFTIEFPPCPTSAIRPGSLCLGFYKEKQECPAFGASSKEPGSCRCDGPGGTWQC